MVDLSIELIRLKQGPPSLENRVCNLKHTNVGGRVLRLESGNKVLENSAVNNHPTFHTKVPSTTYIHQVIPSLPEVTISDHTDGLSQLGLNTSRDRNHQTDQFLLDSSDLVQLKLVVSIFIRPVSLNEVLEA